MHELRTKNTSVCAAHKWSTEGKSKRNLWGSQMIIWRQKVLENCAAHKLWIETKKYTKSLHLTSTGNGLRTKSTRNLWSSQMMEEADWKFSKDGFPHNCLLIFSSSFIFNFFLTAFLSTNYLAFILLYRIFKNLF
jgi:hypothetical protein